MMVYTVDARLSARGLHQPNQIRFISLSLLERWTG
jgi:hypothetical protein